MISILFNDFCVRVCVPSRLVMCLTFATPWTVACQAPLYMGVSRQEYWSGLPLPTPGIFPSQGLNPSLFHLLHLQADSFTAVPPGKPSDFQ